MRRLLLPLFLLMTPVLGHSQEPATPPRLFLDCSGFRCDRDFLRTEIDFVRYVRDRQDADIHLLITTQRTGGGGTAYTLSFLGRERFAGMQDTLRHVASQTATEAEEREGLARTIKLGLARYLARTPLAGRLEISFVGDAGDGDAEVPVDDPWNFWTFHVSARGNFDGSAQDRSQSLSGRVSASRVTEEWKLDFDVDGEYERDYIEIERDSVTTVITPEEWAYEVDGLVVRSLGRHWSAGATGSVSASTFLNQEMAVRLAPAVEYSIFPYGEATRKQLTLRYSFGATYFDYVEETLFGETTETLLNHGLEANVDVTQPWGSLDISAEGFQYVTDPTKYRAELGGDVDVRLLRGLSLNLFGRVSYVRDQIYLAKGGLSPEEILLRLRERESAYRYFVGVGLSYTFGSIYSGVVNPRFD